MAEELVLTDPIVTTPVSTEKYRIVSMILDIESAVVDPTTPMITEPGLVRITLRDNNQIASYYQYVGQKAIDMMKWMNTANFSTTSMQKRVLQKLTQDGLLPPGEITGTPEI